MVKQNGLCVSVKRQLQIRRNIMAKKLLLFAFFLVLMALIVGCAAVQSVAYPNPFSPETENGLTMTLGVAMDLPPPTAIDKTYAASVISIPRFEAIERNIRPNMKYTGNENADGRGETTALAMMNGGGLSHQNSGMYTDEAKVASPQLCDQGVARSPEIAGDAIVFFAHWVDLNYATRIQNNSPIYDLATVNTSSMTVWYYHTGKTPAADNGNNHENTSLPSTFGNDAAVVCESGSTAV